MDDDHPNEFTDGVGTDQYDDLDEEELLRPLEAVREKKAALSKAALVVHGENNASSAADLDMNDAEQKRKRELLALPAPDGGGSTGGALYSLLL